MIKKLLYILFSSVFASALAQNICPIGLKPQYHVNFNVASPTIDYNYNTNQLHTMSPSGDPVGLYVGDKSIHILPHARTFTDNVTGNMCGVVADLTVEFTYQPHIHIAQETQGLACTINRVLNHEKTHYGIEMRAIDVLKNNMEEILKKNFNQSFYAHNINELQTILTHQENQAMNDINNIFNQNTKPYHAQIDTHESYEQDSKLCSREENQILFSRLPGNQ